MTQSAEEVARGLTHPQKRYMRRLKEFGSISVSQIPSRVAHRLEAAGLVIRDNPISFLTYEISLFGLAVARELEARDD